MYNDKNRTVGSSGRRIGATWLRFRVLGVSAAIALAMVPPVASAQVRMTVPPQAEPIALRGATIHTVTNGVIENGTIIFRNGVIEAIGTDVEIPEGTRVVDVSGKHIYPGLIDAYSTVGISEVGAVDMSNDVNEVGDFNPNINADVGVNAESRHIGTSRSQGVLTTLTTPGGGLISGMSRPWRSRGGVGRRCRWSPRRRSTSTGRIRILGHVDSAVLAGSGVRTARTAPRTRSGCSS
jgi:hypothetical protein